MLYFIKFIVGSNLSGDHYFGGPWGNINCKKLLNTFAMIDGKSEHYKYKVFFIRPKKLKQNYQSLTHSKNIIVGNNNNNIIKINRCKKT